MCNRNIFRENNKLNNETNQEERQIKFEGICTNGEHNKLVDISQRETKIEFQS